MYNQEISKRKERTITLIIILSAFAFVFFIIISSRLNPPEKQFRDCLSRYGDSGTSTSDEFIRSYCCLEVGYVPLIDYEGKFFVCQSPTENKKGERVAFDEFGGMNND